jgi:hypothetical protein
MGAVKDSKQQLIAAAEDRAAKLFDAAPDEATKERVQQAARDIGEAVMWLNQPHAESRPYILRIVDLTLELVNAKLTAIERALRYGGPGAPTIT